MSIRKSFEQTVCNNRLYYSKMHYGMSLAASCSHVGQDLRAANVSVRNFF